MKSIMQRIGDAWRGWLHRLVSTSGPNRRKGQKKRVKIIENSSCKPKRLGYSLDMKTKDQLIAEKVELKKAIAALSKLRANVGYLCKRLAAVEKQIASK